MGQRRSSTRQAPTRPSAWRNLGARQASTESMATVIETEPPGARQADRQAPPVGKWVGIPDAAQRLGLSVDAVRRRVRRKTLRSRRVPTEHGGPARYEVWVEEGAPGARQADGVARQAPDSAHQAARHSEPRIDAAALAVSRAREMAEYTERLLLPWRDRVEQLSQRLGHLEAELAAARREEAERQARLAVPRPWWRFW
jgi:BMFP domain-containing protein YqiC